MRRGLHVLITGASGFIGQALSRAALDRGHQVTGLVRPGAVGCHGPKRIEYQLGSSEPLVLPSNIDAVVHLAQSRAYTSFPQHADEMFRVNVQGTHEVLLAAAAARVRYFCNVSSGTVYEPYVGGLVESAAVGPPSFLGASKLAAETIARAYDQVFQLSTLRLFAPYGPHQTGRLVPDLIRRVATGQAVTLPPEGAGMRFTPTHIEDLCAALLTGLEVGWTGTINVAAPEVITIEDAARTIGRVLGREPLFERKAQSAPQLVPDLTRLGTMYDMSRFRCFADGVVAMIRAQD